MGDDAGGGDALDAIEVGSMRRSARSKVLLWVLVVGVVGVGGVLLVQRFVADRVRKDALARANASLTRYVDTLAEEGSLVLGLQRRQLRGLVDGSMEGSLDGADEACNALGDALFDLQSSDITLPSCESLVSHSGCVDLSPGGLDEVLRRVTVVERCRNDLQDQQEEGPNLDLGVQALSAPPHASFFPPVPDGYRLRGEESWWPSDHGFVVTAFVHDDARCRESDERGGLDCVRPSVFTVPRKGKPSTVRTYPMPDDCRGWHRAAVAEDGTFVAHARGPGIQRVFRRTFDGDESDTWIRWDPETPTGPQELAKLSWLAAAWRALERQRPTSVGVRRRQGIEPESKTRLALPSGHATLHFEERELILAIHRDGDDDGPELRHLASAGDHPISEARMSADDAGRIAVRWKHGVLVQWLVVDSTAPR